MSWSIEEFSDCFRFGTLFRVKYVFDDSGKCAVHRLRKKKSVFYEERPPLVARVALDNIGSLQSLQAGDILFRRECDMEASVLRPGVNMPDIKVRAIDFHHR